MKNEVTEIKSIKRGTHDLTGNDHTGAGRWGRTKQRKFKATQ